MFNNSDNTKMLKTAPTTRIYSQHNSPCPPIPLLLQLLIVWQLLKYLLTNGDVFFLYGGILSP